MISSNIHGQYHYPFGMLMPARQYTGPENYRYGFQGQEKDDEIKGENNSLAFKYRIHDPRLGRFLSMDPLSNTFPWMSPYHFAGNEPIRAIDLEGAEAAYVIRGMVEGTNEILFEKSQWYKPKGPNTYITVKVEVHVYSSRQAYHAGASPKRVETELEYTPVELDFLYKDISKIDPKIPKLPTEKSNEIVLLPRKGARLPEPDIEFINRTPWKTSRKRASLSYHKLNSDSYKSHKAQQQYEQIDNELERFLSINNKQKKISSITIHIGDKKDFSTNVDIYQMLTSGLQKKLEKKYKVPVKLEREKGGDVKIKVDYKEEK